MLWNASFALILLTILVSASSTTSTNTNSSTNHSPNQQPHPYTPIEHDIPSSAFSSQGHSAAPHHSIGLNQRWASGNLDDSSWGSVNSCTHQYMESLRLKGPTFLYLQIANSSQTSLASGLQQQRGIQCNGMRLSNGNVPVSPHWSGNSITQRNPIARRIAPPIMERPRDRSQFAPEPTRGRPWAFPDPDESVAGSLISRRSSQASSFTNSIYSELDRPLPPRQHGTS